MLYSEILADFIFNLQYENIPDAVVQRAKELMLDSLGTYSSKQGRMRFKRL